MSVVDDSERRLFRAIRRRRMLRGLVFLVPTAAIWWLLSHWVERRFHIHHDPAQLGTLLVVVGAIAVLERLGLTPARDPRETSRLRWLRDERLDLIRSRTRRWQIVGFSLFLLVSCVMLLDRSPPGSGTGWGTIVMMVISTGAVAVRLPKTMDELVRSHHLSATRWAYIVTVSCCTAALLLGSQWPDRLPGSVTISLLAGGVSYQIVLEVLASRATSLDG